MKNTGFVVLGVVALIAAGMWITKAPLVEGYRDPIYLNRAKYAYDYYPRSNGTIYGFPYQSGLGSWHIFSGFPLYDKAY